MLVRTILRLTGPAVMSPPPGSFLRLVDGTTALRLVDGLGKLSLVEG